MERNTRIDHFWALETSPSNEIEDTRLGVGRRGIAMCFRPSLQLFIYDQGSLARNRIQWIRFKGLEGGHLGILNVYASNMVGERCAMWNEVFQFLPTDCRWIMTSDLNMVKSPLDRSTSTCSHLLGLKE